MFNDVARRVTSGMICMLIGLAPVAAQTRAQPKPQGLYDQFVEAVAVDRSDEVTALLARGMDPNTVDPHGDPMLVVAARAGFEPTFDALLRAGAKVDAKNGFGDTAIMVAALGGHLTIVKKLYARGAEINPPGWTPLAYAATNGNTDVVRYLLEIGAKRQRGFGQWHVAVDDGRAGRARRNGGSAARQRRRRQPPQPERCERARLGHARRLLYDRESADQARRQALAMSVRDRFDALAASLFRADDQRSIDLDAIAFADDGVAIDALAEDANRALANIRLRMERGDAGSLQRIRDRRACRKTDLDLGRVSGSA